jgi:RimJ/RimL family protein N-acetyltransferase
MTTTPFELGTIYSSTIPVVVAACDEPEGLIERHVYPMPLSIENLRTFWEKAQQFRTVFGDEVNGDFKKFLELFISQEGDSFRAHGLFWVIDDFVGVYYMTHLTEVECQVHYTFFDRRHKGREELTRAMLRYAFNKFGFQRMSVEIPMYASRHTFGFTYALGFKKEGLKRNCVYYKGEWFSATCFGLLREAALNGH